MPWLSPPCSAWEPAMHHEKVDFDQSSTLSWWKHVVLANSMAKTHSILTHQKNDTVLCFFPRKRYFKQMVQRKWVCVSTPENICSHRFTQHVEFGPNAWNVAPTILPAWNMLRSEACCVRKHVPKRFHTKSDWHHNCTSWTMEPTETKRRIPFHCICLKLCNDSSPTILSHMASGFFASRKTMKVNGEVHWNSISPFESKQTTITKQSEGRPHFKNTPMEPVSRQSLDWRSWIKIRQELVGTPLSFSVEAGGKMSGQKENLWVHPLIR